MYNLFPAVWLKTGLIDDDVSFSLVNCFHASIPFPIQMLNREAQFYLSNTREYFSDFMLYARTLCITFFQASADQSYSLDSERGNGIAYPRTFSYPIKFMFLIITT
jgi:hypothetical protein